MKNLIITLILIIGCLACTNHGETEYFDHCDDDPARFENSFEIFDTPCTFPWHDHKWFDHIILSHIEGNTFALNSCGFSLETIRDGCNFTIVEKQLELSGKMYKLSGIGYHTVVCDNTSGPCGDRAVFDITYEHNSIETTCRITGTRW